MYNVPVTTSIYFFFIKKNYSSIHLHSFLTFIIFTQIIKNNKLISLTLPPPLTSSPPLLTTDYWPGPLTHSFSSHTKTTDLASSPLLLPQIDYWHGTLCHPFSSSTQTTYLVIYLTPSSPTHRLLTWPLHAGLVVELHTLVRTSFTWWLIWGHILPGSTDIFT